VSRQQQHWLVEPCGCGAPRVYGSRGVAPMQYPGKPRVREHPGKGLALGLHVHLRSWVRGRPDRQPRMYRGQCACRGEA
jgi:hypothetical protein